MTIEYKRIKFNPDALPALGEQDWQLVTIYEGVMYFSRTVKAKPKSTALAVKHDSNTMKFLVSCYGKTEQAITWAQENNLSIDTLYEFSAYWLEKSENGTKYRFEKEKVFDIRRRLQTWLKRNLSSNSRERGITILD